MIVTHIGGRKVRIRSRNPETNERRDYVVEAYPYCFAKNVNDRYGLVKVEEGYEGLYGTDLSKVHFRTEYDRRLWSKHTDTWEAHITFPNQVLNDRLVKGEDPIPNYEHRVWYLDGEWKTTSGEITMLSVLDSYTKRMLTWVTSPDIEPGLHKSLPCIDHPDGLKEIHFDTPVRAFANERQLLAHFASQMSKHDPDVIAGWYVVDADIKQICDRMRAVGLNPKSLSPYNRHDFMYNWSDKHWSQPIPGRLCFDLMVGFKRLWTIKNGQLASQKLDDIAWHVLQERKVDLPNGHDTYYSDVGTYLDYNRQDVRLLPRLDEAVNAVGYHTSMQHLVQCQLATTPLITAMSASLFLQDNEFDLRIPDSPKFEKRDYAGADIQEPEPGRYTNIAIMDIKAMYHSNVNLHNICWTTLSDEGLDCGSGAKFMQGDRGLLGRTMDKLTVKRNEYKALMKQARADGDEIAYKKWDGAQFATKSMVASLYGICGDSKFGMYHPDIAAAITYTSRQTLFRLRDECNERGYPVRYGHTDSIFCEVPSPEEGMVLVDEINKAMAPIETEFEKWCESMILKRKNRYAGKVTWTDGQSHEPEYYYKGLELKQARMPKAMKSTMDSILRAILDGVAQDEVDTEVCGLITKGINGELAEDVLMVGKLKRRLSQYKVLSGASAGADWAKKNLGRNYEVDEAFLTAVNKRGQHIAFDNFEQLQGVCTIDWARMTETYIVNKACDIYDLVGWSTQELWNAHRGLGAVQWI
jgi:DNA polymerase elongation subunit (family B)